MSQKETRVANIERTFGLTKQEEELTSILFDVFQILGCFEQCIQTHLMYDFGQMVIIIRSDSCEAVAAVAAVFGRVEDRRRKRREIE